MAVKRNYFFWCILGSIVIHLTSHKGREHDCLPHSGGNCLLEDLYSLKATQNPDSRPSNPRSTTGSLKWRLIKLFEPSKVSSWNIFCMHCVLNLLFALLYSFFFIPGSPYKSDLFIWSSAVCNDFIFCLNSTLKPVIYCWKMGPIRRTLMDIMRGIVNQVRE